VHSALILAHGAAVAGQNPSMLLRFAVNSAVALVLLSGWAHAAGSERVERGRALLSQYQCGSCHAIPGVASSRGRIAQPLEAWGRRSYIAGRLPNRPELLARWIAAPQSLVPGTAMPSMGASPSDAQAMAAYLLTLR
jgi:cytochrome c2